MTIVIDETTSIFMAAMFICIGCGLLMGGIYLLAGWMLDVLGHGLGKSDDESDG